MLKIMTGLGVLVLLSGCQAMQENMDKYTHDYLLKPGDSMNLLVPVVFPDGHARVLLQQQFHGQNTGAVGFANGYRFNGSGVNEYKPFCELEVSVLSDGQFEVVPDKFEVTRVEQALYPWNFVGLPVQLAQTNDGSLDQMTYATEIYLRSTINPDVRRMSCRQVMDVDIGEFVSVEQMRMALAGVFEIVR